MKINQKVTRITFIDSILFKTSLDHPWKADKLSYVHWPGATSNLSQRYFNASNSFFFLNTLNEQNTWRFLYFSSSIFILGNRSSHILSILDFLWTKFELYLPKSQIIMNVSYSHAFCNCFKTVDISWCKIGIALLFSFELKNCTQKKHRSTKGIDFLLYSFCLNSCLVWKCLSLDSRQFNIYSLRRLDVKI